MQKNSFKNIIRVCYFTFYAIIFLFLIFICFKPDIIFIIIQNGQLAFYNEQAVAYILMYSIATLFTFFYILTTGLSVKDNFKTSVSRFVAYTASLTLLATFYCAVATYFSEPSDELIIAVVFSAIYFTATILIAWIIWIIHLTIFSKVSLQKNEKVSNGFQSLILVSILIIISVFFSYVGISTGQSFTKKRAALSWSIRDIIYNQKNCKTDSDCVSLTHSGPFKGYTVNKEYSEIVRQEIDEYCKKYSYDCQTQATSFTRKAWKACCIEDSCGSCEFKLFPSKNK